MQFIYEEKRFIKNFRQPSVWPPITQTWARLTTLYRLWMALQLSVYRIPISNLEDLRDKVHTCWENLDQQIIDKSIADWRDRLKAVFKWMVDTWNGCFYYLVHFLPCSGVQRMRSKNMRAFCHRVSSVIVVLWQKVNLTNNHLTFLDDMDLILCQNKWCLKWHINQHCALACL